MWKPILIGALGLQANTVTAQTAPAPSGYFPPPSAQASIRCGWPIVGSRSRTIAVDTFADEWLSTHLKAAGEPSLYRASRTRPATGAGALRFSWLPSFHHPVMVRIVWNEGRPPRLIATALSGQGGYAPGSVSKRIDRPISAEEAAQLQALLRRTRVLEAPPATCALGTDGAEWIVESQTKAGYRLIVRWSPKDGAVRELGTALLKLTGWRFEEIY